MKKLFVVLAFLFLIIVFSIYSLYLNFTRNSKEIANYNSEYNKFLDKTIYGAELATLINKAANENELNNVEKNERKHYIENEDNSIKIEIKISVTNKTYPMEEIYNKDISEFIKYFDTASFKCTKIDYHEKTGKIRSMLFEQID